MAMKGKRVLITRTRSQASDLARILEELGAVPILIPTIEIAPPASEEPLRTILSNLSNYDWLLFTSANAVEAFGRRLDAAQWTGIRPRVAAIGQATARALKAVGIEPDLIPPQAVAESFAEALLPHASGARMALIRAAQARDHLPHTLEASGAQLTIAEAYRTVIPETSVRALRELFRQTPPDAITFTSSSTATNLMELLQAAGLSLPEGMVLASIGPITSETLRGLGHPATIESAEATTQGLADALAEYWRTEKS